MGQNTISQTNSEFTVGAYNDTVTGTSNSIWYNDDKVFQVGTGQSNSTRSSSFVVYKNGNVLIAPANGLQQDGGVGGNTSYGGWYSPGYSFNNVASLEIAPINSNNTNPTLKVFGRDNNTNIVVQKNNYTSGKKFMSFVSGANAGEIGSITISASVNSISYNTTSDARLKIDNGKFEDGLSKINSIRIHNYTWKEGGKDIGVFAQELYKVYPMAVSKGDDKEVTAINEIQQRWQVDYSKLVPVLVAATQELSKQNDDLKIENELLRKQLIEFDKRLASLEYNTDIYQSSGVQSNSITASTNK